MSFVVSNCFHWVGYHIAEALINDGENVYGIEKPGNNNQPHLEMFFGRNSLFHRKERLNEQITGPFIHVEEDQIIFKSNKDDSEKNITTLFLFGEWMPMDTSGMYQNDKYLSFSSTEFKQNGIYIKIFIEYLLKWIKVENINSDLTIKRTNFKEYHCAINDDTVYLYDYISLETRKQELVKHFKQFKEMYIDKVI